MLLWSLPPIPGFSKFLFAICAVLFLFGIAAYIIERRKEIKKEKKNAEQRKSFA